MKGLVVCSVVTERIVDEYLLMRFPFRFTINRSRCGTSGAIAPRGPG